MKHRNLIITAGIFVVLLIYVLMTQTGNKGFDTLKLPEVPKITADQINKVTLTKASEQIVLEKKGDAWELVKPFTFEADKNKVDAMNRLLGEIRITNVVTQKAENKADYGLNSETATALVVEGNDKKIELTLGSPNADNSHTYIQLPGDEKVYQLLGDFSRQTGMDSKAWRSLRVFEFSTDGVKSVSIERKDRRPVAFVKKQEVKEAIVKDGAQKVSSTALPTKTVWEDKASGVVLDDPKVNMFLNTFTRLAAHEIVDEPWKGKSPYATIAVTNQMKDYTLEILKFLKAKDRYLVRRKGDAYLYEISKYHGDQLLKTIDDFKK